MYKWPMLSSKNFVTGLGAASPDNRLSFFESRINASLLFIFLRLFAFFASVVFLSTTRLLVSWNFFFCETIAFHPIVNYNISKRTVLLRSCHRYHCCTRLVCRHVKFLGKCSSCKTSCTAYCSIHLAPKAFYSETSTFCNITVHSMAFSILLFWIISKSLYNFVIRSSFQVLNHQKMRCIKHNLYYTTTIGRVSYSLIFSACVP